MLNKIKLPKAVKDKLEELVPGLRWTRADMDPKGFVAGSHIEGPQCFLRVEWPEDGVFYSPGTKVTFFIILGHLDDENDREFAEVVKFNILCMNNHIKSCEKENIFCDKACFDWENRSMKCVGAKGVIKWL